MEKSNDMKDIVDGNKEIKKPAPLTFIQTSSNRIDFSPFPAMQIFSKNKQGEKSEEAKFRAQLKRSRELKPGQRKGVVVGLIVIGAYKEFRRTRECEQGRGSF